MVGRSRGKLTSRGGWGHSRATFAFLAFNGSPGTSSQLPVHNMLYVHSSFQTTFIRGREASPLKTPALLSMYCVPGAVPVTAGWEKSTAIQPSRAAETEAQREATGQEKVRARLSLGSEVVLQVGCWGCSRRVSNAGGQEFLFARSCGDSGWWTLHLDMHLQHHWHSWRSYQ